MVKCSPSTTTMWGTILRLLLLVYCCCCVLSKPMEDNGDQIHGGNNSGVVEMGVKDVNAVGADKQDKVAADAVSDTNKAADDKQQANGDILVGKTDDPAANTAVRDGQEHPQDQTTETIPTKDNHGRLYNKGQELVEAANEKTQHITRDDDVDWGHGKRDDLSQIKFHDEPVQQEQQKERDHKEQNAHEQQLEGKKNKEQQQQTQDPLGDTHQKDGHTGQHGDGQEPVGVANAEHLAHGDVDHNDHHAGEEVTPSPEDVEAEKKHQAELRFQSEQQELKEAQPTVIGNVHDGVARKVAEFMKHQQFGPHDAEEAMHGGKHVHAESPEGSPKEDQAGDVEMLVHGEAGVHDHSQEDDKAPLSLDPDELMHTGQGNVHVHHQDPEANPGASDIDTLIQGHDKETGHRVKEVPTGPVGPDYETAVHDGEHVHQVQSGKYKPKNKVTYQNIIDLGLDQEMLKGIDLTKLLEQEKKELEDWHKETQASSEDEDPNIDDKQRSAAFWEKQVTNLRKTYLEKLYAKVRHISNPDLEHAEWEKDDDSVRGLRDPSAVHEGESVVEHEMELWASTIAKGDRKPLKVLRERWSEKSEDGKTEEKQDVGDSQSDVAVDTNPGETEKDAAQTEDNEKTDNERVIQVIGGTEDGGLQEIGDL